MVERASRKWRSERVYIANPGAGRFYSLIPFLARLRMASTSSPTHLIPTCVTHLPIFDLFYSLWTRPHPSSQAPTQSMGRQTIHWARLHFHFLRNAAFWGECTCGGWAVYTRSRFAQCTNSSTRTTAAPASSTLFLAHPCSLPFLHALLSYITDREPGFFVYD